MAMYGKLDYWQERYTHSGDTTTYDWYQTYGSLKHLLSVNSLVKPFSTTSNNQDRSIEELDHFDKKVSLFPSRGKCRVLILGCGNSTFGEDMGNDGWTGEIVNIDFSSVVIDQMRSKYESKHGQGGNQFVAPKMKFVCADVTHGLPFKDKSFDLIICKGTFDSILCNIGSMSCSKDLIAECDRVLATGHGCLFLVTYGSPDNRVVFLEHEHDISYYWQGINIHKVKRQSQVGSKNDYVYICRKKWDGTEETSNNKDLSQAPTSKRSGEENIERIDEHSIRKINDVGNSYYEL